MQRIARVFAALVVGSATVAACTTGDPMAPAPAPAGPDVRLTGSVLARTELGRSLVVIDPRDGTEKPVRMPPGSVLVHHASFAEDGTILAAVEGPYGRFGAYRLSVDDDAEPLGPMLRGVFTFDGDDRSILAASCDARRSGYVLDVAAPSVWREVDAACGATLSPDGRSIATSVKGERVDVVPIDAPAEASTVFEIEDVSRAASTVPTDARITGRIAWGKEGIAFTVGTDDVESLVVLSEGAPPIVETFGAHAEWLETALEWRPDGSSIAAAGATQLEGIVRMADPTTGDAHVVAILREPPFGILWSPEGDILLLSTLGRWTFLGADGSWLRVLPYSRGRALPMDWRP
jgi:hypothetical protein